MAIGYKIINARAETVRDKPSFRSAFKQRRCLIPVSGFYEWKRTAKPKQPYFVCPRDRGLFSFAGLWESWHDQEGEVIDSCTILTTSANELMQSIHDRMPVSLDPASDDVWLDASASADALQSLLVPAPSDGMEAIAVNSWVNNTRNQG